MEQLFELIYQLEADDKIEHSEFLSLEIPLVKQISDDASFLLITDDGLCDWANIYYLEDRGIYVFPVESDGFGWLIGGIPTSKGVITYG